MLDASFPSLLAEDRPGTLGTLAGKALSILYKLLGMHRYDDFRLERVLDLKIFVMPGVANPKLLRTGAFFAAQIDACKIAPWRRRARHGHGLRRLCARRGAPGTPRRGRGREPRGRPLRSAQRAA